MLLLLKQARAFGIGVVLAETENAAKSIIEAFNGLKARVIAQEFIEEAGGADIRAFVVEGNIVLEDDDPFPIDQSFRLSTTEPHGLTITIGLPLHYEARKAA